MKQKLFHFINILFLTGCIFFQSCEKENIQPDDQIDAGQGVRISEMPDIPSSDLDLLKAQMEALGYDFSELEAGDDSLQLKSVADLAVRVIKVSCTTNHPDGSDQKVNISGILLVPHLNFITKCLSHQLIVSPPPTYMTNSEAPSNLFKNGIKLIQTDESRMILNYMSIWALQAAAGYAVLIPDYPGFGDSYGDCYIPYIIKEPMAWSTIDLIKATRQALSLNGYKYNNDIILTGYSQGAYVAGCVARELETNPVYGFNVKLLVTGGSPCRIKQLIDIVRETDNVPNTCLVPHAMRAFEANGYISGFTMTDFLKEPNASNAYEVLYGRVADPDDYFSSRVSDLLTDHFRQNLDTDPRFNVVNELLLDNSLKPWVNKCKYVMTHGVQDMTVYYANAYDFASEQKASGGKVTFIDTPGDHVFAVPFYYLKASYYISRYR